MRPNRRGNWTPPQRKIWTSQQTNKNKSSTCVVSQKDDRTTWVSGYSA